MKWIIGFFVVMLAVKLMSAIRPIPVINLDSGPHTITQKVNCDGNNVTTIDTYVDGQFLFTVYVTLPPVTGFSVKP